MKKAVVWLLAVCIAVCFLYPIAVVLAGSFFSPADMQESYARPLQARLRFIPRMATLDQYYAVLVASPNYVIYFMNSVLYAISITLLGMLVVIPAGYVLAKIPFRGSGLVTYLLIIVMIMPFQVTLVANYILVKQIGLFDSLWSIILVGCFAPFGIFLSRQMCISISDEQLEAYDLESKSILKKFWYVILPSIKPALAALAILTFTEAWNMVEQPLVLLESNILMPLSTVLNSVFSSTKNMNHFAGAMLYMAPILVIFYYCKAFIMDGLESMRFAG